MKLLLLCALFACAICYVYAVGTYVSCIYRDAPASNVCNMVFSYTTMYDLTYEPYSEDNTLVLVNITLAAIGTPELPKYLVSSSDVHTWVLKGVPCAINTYDVKWLVEGTFGTTSSQYDIATIQNSQAQCAMGYDGIVKANSTGYQSVSIATESLGISSSIRPLYLYNDRTPLAFYNFNEFSMSAASGIERQFEDVYGSLWIAPVIYDHQFGMTARNTAVRSGSLFYLINYAVPSGDYDGQFGLKMTFEHPVPWPTIPKLTTCGGSGNKCYGYTNPTMNAFNLLDATTGYSGSDSKEKWTEISHQWPTGQTAGVVVGPILGCVTFNIDNSFAPIDQDGETLLTHPGDPYSNTIKIVGFDQSTSERVLYSSTSEAYYTYSFRMCPSAELVQSDPYPNNIGGGEIYCGSPDICGVCDGDNSTCPWDGSSSSYGVPINATYGTQCTVSTLYSGSGGDPSGDPLIQLSAEGTYITGYTDVMANIICTEGAVPGVETTLNSGWVIVDTAVGMDNDRVVYSRNFTQTVRLSVLQSCISGLDGMIQGTISIASTIQSGGNVYYSTPCTYSIDTQASELSVSAYSVSGISVQASVIYQMWIDDVVTPGQNIYTDLAFVIETVIPRSLDTDIMLKDLYIVPVTDSGMPTVTAASGSPCQESDPRASTSCVQVWTLTTQDDMSRSCFAGALNIKYVTEIGDPRITNPAPTGNSYISVTDQSGPDTPAVSVMVMMNACKPRGPSAPVHIPVYNVTVAFYSDAFLTTPTTHFLDGQRIYAAVIIDGLADCGLDLNINVVNICVAKIPGAPVTSCDSADVTSALIWNGATGQSGGTRWNTRVEPLFTQPCGSQRLLSWTTRVMSRAALSSPEVFVQIKWDYGYSSGSVILPSGIAKRGITKYELTKRGILKYDKSARDKKVTPKVSKHWNSKSILGNIDVSDMHTKMVQAGGVVVNNGLKDNAGNRILGFNTPKSRVISRSMVFRPPISASTQHLFSFSVTCPENSQFSPLTGECGPFGHLITENRALVPSVFFWLLLVYVVVLLIELSGLSNKVGNQIMWYFQGDIKIKEKRRERESVAAEPTTEKRRATKRNDFSLQY